MRRLSPQKDIKVALLQFCNLFFDHAHILQPEAWASAQPPGSFPWNYCDCTLGTWGKQCVFYLLDLAIWKSPTARWDKKMQVFLHSYMTAHSVHAWVPMNWCKNVPVSSSISTQLIQAWVLCEALVAGFAKQRADWKMKYLEAASVTVVKQTCSNRSITLRTMSTWWSFFSEQNHWEMPILALEIKQLSKWWLLKPQPRSCHSLAAFLVLIGISWNIVRISRGNPEKTHVKSALRKMLGVQFYAQSWGKKKCQEGLKSLPLYMLWLPYASEEKGL